MGELSIISFLPLILVLVLFFMKVPIGTSLMSGSIVYFIFINTSAPPDLALQKMISGLQSFPLLAIPFFIMVGVVMNYSGISSKLMAFADLLVGHWSGSLGYVNVLLSTLMGGVSGSSNADASMQCKMLVPQMEQRGYTKEFSAAVTASSSLIPSIIPPGISLIIYCNITQQSVGKMFMAGYLPGVMLCLAMMTVCHFEAKKRGYGKTREKRASLKEIIFGAKDAALALFIPLGLLMGLRFGMFTATEGGAISVVYCLIIGAFVYRAIKWKHIFPILRETFISTAGVMFITISAYFFGYYLSWERIPYTLSQVVLALVDNKYTFLLAINVVLLIMGMFIETSPAMIILMPLLMEPLAALGIDPIHFGIIMVLNLQAGGLTPPFGSMMFVCCSILKLPMNKFVKANIPFYLAILAVLAIVTFCPGLVMLIPNMVMG